ncbi:MAG: hypothetical protein K2X47_13860, partial [Bdellovibrionales bacterium]|nr:hypothetical protein [Bdellovibrionales bacterium]
MRTPIEFSDIDSVFLGKQPVPIQMAFFFPGRLDADLVRNSLESVIKKFWPLAGVIDLRNPYRPRIQPNVSDVVLFTQEAQDYLWTPGMDLNLLSKKTLSPLAPQGTKSPTPLFSAQLTNIKNGAVLGVSINHAVVDGYSFFFFMDQWSKVSRGEIPLAPTDDRFLHRGTALGEKQDIASLDPDMFLEKTGFFKDQSANTLPSDQDPFLNPSAEFHWQTLTLSRTDLQAIAEQLNPPDGIRRSQNDILCEFLFRNHGPETGYLTIPVDVRRLSKRLTPTYFGNGIRPVTLKVSRRDPVGSIAQRAGAEVRSLRPEKVEATLNFLATLAQCA